MKTFIHKSIDPTWPMWAVSGKVADTQWFKSLAEAEAFAGFKFKEPVSKLTALLAERDELRAIVEQVAKLTPSTREFHPGIGSGMLNGLIEAATAAIAKEAK